MKICLIALTTLSFASCIKPSSQQVVGGKGSKLVSVSMKMPTKIGQKDITGKLDAYSLKIIKKGGDCTFVDVDKLEKVGSGDVKIDATLKQDCDYAITLGFGVSSADGKKIEKLYLTSDAHDEVAATPKLVSKDDIKGKSAITINACVSVTKLGAADLGVDIAECPSIADDSIDATIEPTVPTPAEVTVKIAEKVKAELKVSPAGTPAKLFIEGKIQSTSAKDQYCAIMHAVTLTNRDTVYGYQSEGLIKIEANMMFNLTTEISKMTEDQRADKVDFHKLYVKCFAVDDATKKSQEVLKDCLTQGKCTEVK